MCYYGRYRVTQAYKSAAHQGIDLVGVDSKIIRSPVNGMIMAARMDNHPTGGMGLYVKIKDRDGIRHLFAHMSKLLVKAGQTVKKGQKIGIEGDTGYSFGSHCHYEVRFNDLASSFFDVTNLMGIPNQIGMYEGIKMTKEEAKRMVKEKAGLSDQTIQYIADDYRWGDDLIVKLAMAMGGYDE